MPAEHEQEVAEGGHGDGDDDKGFVTAGSEWIGQGQSFVVDIVLSSAVRTS